MKSILKYFLFTIFILILLAVAIGYSRYKDREQFRMYDTLSMNKIARGIEKWKVKSLYDLYLISDDYQPNDFLIRERLRLSANRRKEYLFALDKIFQAVDNGKKLSPDDFSQICDYELQQDQESGQLFLKNKLFQFRKVEIKTDKQ